MPTWVLWTACLALVFLRGLVAAAESALYGTSDLRAQELAETHPAPGERVLRHKTEREATATALRVGSVLCGFLAAAHRRLRAAPRCSTSPGWARRPWLTLATVLAGALLVGVLASLVEVTMRGLANADPERWALRLSWLVSLLVFLFYPPMRLLVGRINLVARPFGRTLHFEPPPPPLEELEKLLAAQAANEEVDQSAPAAHPLHLRAVRQALPRRDGAAHRGGVRGHHHPARRDAAAAGRGEPLAHPRLPGRRGPHRRRAPRARPDPAAAAPRADRPAGHHPPRALRAVDEADRRPAARDAAASKSTWPWWSTSTAASWAS